MSRFRSNKKITSRKVLLGLVYLIIISRAAALIYYYNSGTSFNASVISSDFVYDQSRNTYKIDARVLTEEGDIFSGEYIDVEEICNSPKKCKETLEDLFEVGSVQEFKYRPVTFLTKDKYFITRADIKMSTVDILELVIYAVIGLTAPMFI